MISYIKNIITRYISDLTDLKTLYKASIVTTFDSCTIKTSDFLPHYDNHKFLYNYKVTYAVRMRSGFSEIWFYYKHLRF